MTSISTVKHITDVVPHEAICETLGVKPRSIRLARENGFFPASWYAGMKQLCAVHGVDCTEDVFNFKSLTSADAIKGGNERAVRQGSGNPDQGTAA